MKNDRNSDSLQCISDGRDKSRKICGGDSHEMERGWEGS